MGATSLWIPPFLPDSKNFEKDKGKIISVILDTPAWNSLVWYADLLPASTEFPILLPQKVNLLLTQIIFSWRTQLYILWHGRFQGETPCRRSFRRCCRPWKFEDTAIGQHEYVCSLISGEFNCRRPHPKYSCMWDVQCVLDFSKRN